MSAPVGPVGPCGYTGIDSIEILHSPRWQSIVEDDTPVIYRKYRNLALLRSNRGFSRVCY